MYDLAKKYIRSQISLPQKDNLIAELEYIEKSDDKLSLLPNFILKLYDIAEQQNYLNRENASVPIQRIAECPPIYQAIKILTDAAVQLKIEWLQQIKTQEQLNQLIAIFPQNIRIDSKESFIQAIQFYFRISLITGQKDNLEQFNWWKEEDHYFKYPTELFKEKGIICDRLDVDAILSLQHFSTLPIETVIRRQDSQYQMQPGFVSLGTDEAAQYDPETRMIHKLLSPHYKEGERVGKPVDLKGTEDYPVRLLSTRVTNCHTVIIRDSRNQYLMLHVSPASITGASDNPFFFSTPKKAYLDLQPLYTNAELGLQKNSTIDIVVVDNGDYFDLEQLKKRLPEGIQINSLATMSPKIDAGQYYSVCFVPGENTIYIQSKNNFVEHTHIFMPQEHPHDLKAQPM
ncbi:hypothetical protein LEAN103870_04885 [Legionella anisa]|uniref:FHA domain-containing protein n=1 Tax=Legionella anisa TaxID=28082 RepID=A0AAX0WN35_9GAMM|nr:hypothetical protein [Legionella anisa]AWN73109.1 hypothetical protein DLD14_04245 [Legionella anisa]KTC67456.1 hypothetical protein Lani_3801 [Legionella anisa]MCW8423939.1 hypothetical protein [Legionella anisa]MCW8447461.1 hypothetical protein [Legionella anisa]PNL60227.1 hypothetical protein A6J39_002835 [Legionella anisa]